MKMEDGGKIVKPCEIVDCGVMCMWHCAAPESIRICSKLQCDSEDLSV